MYIDKYTINSYGNEYKGNKTLKNQELLTTVKSKDGNRLKKRWISFLEEYEELHHPYNSEIELIINIQKIRRLIFINRCRGYILGTYIN